MLLASSVADLVEHKDSKFYSLRHLFIQPQECIVEKFQEVVDSFSLDIEEELESATDKTINLVVEINNLWESLPIIFEDLLETSEVDAGFELLACTGAGTRFWDNYNLSDFGLLSVPLLPYIESFYEEAYLILEKVQKAKRKQTFEQFSCQRKAA